jgi:radical SAM family uncharacterized protein/radical SAM-linked protein
MRELLPLFAKPSRYLGSEWGVVLKDPATVSVRLALAFPDLYEVGMSYLGQKILYAAVNARPQYWAERAYAPGRDVIALLRQRGLPLCTLESDTPLGRLDAVSFHLTHELCYTNVLLMLDLAGIPLRACERDERHPLVIAGGGAAFNAEPLAPFFDLMQLGEGEESLPRLLDLLAGHKARGASRREFLLAAAALPGVYVPAFFEDVSPGRTPRPLIPGYERVAKAVVPDLNRAVIPTRQIVPFGGVVHDRLILEIARGCTRGCRFCHAGMVYRPVRERKPEDLARFIEEGLAATGFEELSFLSLSTGDYSALEALFDASFSRCAAEQVAISLPSLRVGSVSERLYGLMSRIRRTGVTIAPEAGSQRLRDVINKGVTEEGLLSHVAMLFAKGWSQVKLYFMIGLPTETDEDLVAIFELCKKVLAQAPRGLRRLQVSAALAIFIPKPHTPFQWEEQVSLDEARRRIDLLRDLFRTDTRLTLRWHEPRMSFLEGVFSRAGRELSGVVERAYVKGALFTAWEDQLDLDKWLEALAEEGLDAQRYLAARDPEAELPWDHLDPGVDKRFLLAERARAYAGKISADCRFEACRACGVCAVGERPSRLPEAADLKPQVVFARRDQEPGEKEEPVKEEGEAQAAVPPSGRQRPPETPEALGVKAAHYRLWFTKTGPAAYLSTLEVQSVFERALRRAGVKPAFSKGFHPKPLFSFGPALPVGVSSLAEWVNLFTRESYPPEDVLARLATQLPEGLVLTRVEALTEGKRQAQAVREDFVLTHTGEEAGREAFLDAWSRFAAAGSWPFTRISQKGERTLDARPYFAGIEVQAPDRVRFSLDWSQGYVSPLALVQAVTPGLTLLDLQLTKTAQHLA